MTLELDQLTLPQSHSHFHQQPRLLGHGKSRSPRLSAPIKQGILAFPTYKRCHSSSCVCFSIDLLTLDACNITPETLAGSHPSISRMTPLLNLIWLVKRNQRFKTLTGMFLVNLNKFLYRQTVCIRPNAGNCCIKYSPCTDTNSFTIDQNANPGTAMLDAACSEDYLGISGKFLNPIYLHEIFIKLKKPCCIYRGSGTMCTVY